VNQYAAFAVAVGVSSDDFARLGGFIVSKCALGVIANSILLGYNSPFVIISVGENFVALTVGSRQYLSIGIIVIGSCIT